MKINIISRSKHGLLYCSTEGLSGMDLRENIDNDIVLRPMQRTLVPVAFMLRYLLVTKHRYVQESVLQSIRELLF
jgi:dUTP pyrophosphatase